jgi:hypothetical protein
MSWSTPQDRLHTGFSLRRCRVVTGPPGLGCWSAWNRKPFSSDTGAFATPGSTTDYQHDQASDRRIRLSLGGRVGRWILAPSTPEKSPASRLPAARLHQDADRLRGPVAVGRPCHGRLPSRPPAVTSSPRSVIRGGFRCARGARSWRGCWGWAAERRGFGSTLNETATRGHRLASGTRDRISYGQGRAGLSIAFPGLVK